jgi:hypothetical protein
VELDPSCLEEIELALAGGTNGAQVG